MELRPEDITIAVTVYNRREFLRDAILGAINQTVPVKVMVVEDCGPDPSLREYVLRESGGRVEYFRNPRNRGLFDNWNACMEYCRTPWISILHDDDQLRPHFVETMLELARQAPDRALYRGESAVLLENGEIISPPPGAWKDGWQNIDLGEIADQDFNMRFPGNLFQIAVTQACGAVRPNSYYTGDWDFWFRLALQGGAAQTAVEVALSRLHYGPERGSSRVERMGWRWALENVQRKRNLALLRRQKGIQIRFDRTKHLRRSPIPSRVLLKYARGYTRRILHYNTWLFTHSDPPHAAYAALQWLARLLGPQIIRACSALRTK